MSISSEQHRLFTAAAQFRLDGLGSDGIRALPLSGDPCNRRNSANPPYSHHLFLVSSLAMPDPIPLWHTSCSAVLCDADPSVDSGNQEAE